MSAPVRAVHVLCWLARGASGLALQSSGSSADASQPHSRWSGADGGELAAALPGLERLRSSLRAAQEALASEGRSVESVHASLREAAAEGTVAGGGSQEAPRLASRRAGEWPEPDAASEDQREPSEPEWFRVDMPPPYPSVAYRRSKNLSDRYSATAANGEIVQGVVQDDSEWLLTSLDGAAAYIPMRAGGARTLQPLARRRPSQSASMSEAAVSQVVPEDALQSEDAYNKYTSTILFNELAMLSPAQTRSLRHLLDGVHSGKIGKETVEIVVSQYDEDIAWSSMYSGLLTVYCKGNIYKHQRPRGCHSLENVGRESHTYLHHIVQNYDKLADWTVFTQAQAPTAGWSSKPGDRHNGHMHPGATFHDYVLGGGPFSDNRSTRFVYNGHWKTPVVGAVNWTRGVLMAFPEHYFSAVGGARERVLSPCLPQNIGPNPRMDLGGEQVMRSMLDLVDFLGVERGKIDYSQGARFSATREKIRERPREFYEKLLDMVSHDNAPVAGVFFELLWPYIIGNPPKEPPCPVEKAPKPCPDGFEQLGEFGDAAPGTAGQLGAVIKSVSFKACADACGASKDCKSFEFQLRFHQCRLLDWSVASASKQVGFHPGALTCRKAAHQRQHAD